VLKVEEKSRTDEKKFLKKINAERLKQNQECDFESCAYLTIQWTVARL